MGPWFVSENGLHQNWMRDYDATLGRYIQPDPLGLVDGASVYGYALQHPSPAQTLSPFTQPKTKGAAGFPAAPLIDLQSA